ncbi:MAG: hypothetical protein MUE41_05865 [Gemmatimonadaceae bacterium]|jgi:hypothetical protein|nr:hypothetical protein [Gemmatimonadaceae bacterium]
MRHRLGCIAAIVTTLQVVGTSRVAAQQMVVRGRDMSPPAVATPTRPWGAPPSGGGAWGATARVTPDAPGGPWSAWPRAGEWRDRRPDRAFTNQGQVAAIGQPFPAGVVPFTTGGGVVVAQPPVVAGAYFPPRVVMLLLPTCDGFGNCWRQPTQVTAIWHAPWQRYIWVDAAGRAWPL